MENEMATSNSNNLVNPNAREAMNRFKMEAAAEMGVNLKQGYNGDLTSRQAGSIGGQMVKKMIAAYENGMQESEQNPKKQGRGIPRPCFLFASFPGISGEKRLDHGGRGCA